MQGVTKEAVLELQPWYLGKNAGSDVLNTKQKEIKWHALRCALRTMSDWAVPPEETIPQFAGGYHEVVQAPSQKSEWVTVPAWACGGERH